jgi:hypothetical protein
VDRNDNTPAREENYYRIKILKEEGRKYADIEIPFLKKYESINNIKARTIRPDGSIVNFEGKPMEKSIVKAKGVKILAKTFTMPDVQPGCIIEYYYTSSISDDYLFDSHWTISDQLFTKNAKFSLKMYERRSIRWVPRLPAGAAAPNSKGSQVTLEVANVPAFETEDYMPPENELKYWVDFVYSDQPFEKDIDKFWKQKGKAWNGYLEDFVGKRKAMEQAVAQIVAPNDPPETKLRKIYARVQQFRNTSYEVRKSEQQQKRDKEKEAANVEELWKAGYGNDRGLRWLFLGLVRAAGFEAYGAWVSDRRNYFFNQVSGEDQKLNENVVLVKVNGKDMYFDPGAVFVPFGLLPWAETGVTGLRLDKDGGTWIKTDLPASSVSTIERKAQLKLTDTGDLEGKLTVTYTGLEAAWRRTEECTEDETDRKKFLEDEVKEVIPTGSEVELTNKPEWKSSDPVFVAEFSVKVPGWASAAGRRVLVSVGIFSNGEKRVFDHTDRVHPVYYHFQAKKLDDITIELPPGLVASSLPKNKNVDTPVIAYGFQAEKGKDSVHLTRKLSVNMLLLPAQYYTALRNFYQEVRTSDEEQIVLQSGVSTSGK